MSIINNNLLLAGTDESYNLTRSLRFRSSASAYLSRTPASAGDRQKWTWSGWVKRGSLSSSCALFGADGSNYMFMYFSPDSLDCGEVVGSQQWRRITSQVFRDPSAWYHVVFAFDSTQSTAGNRIKLYVNGSQITAFSTSVDPSLNYSSVVNTTVAHSIGSFAAPTRQAYLDGYLTEVNFVDGQQLTPSSFGETDLTTGVWKPKRYVGTYGTNGFYLPFTDNSALTTSSNAGLGKDFSGNGNYWTTNNISITSGTTYDSMTDVPTLTSATAANFAVLNPLDTGGTAPTNGNLTLTAGAAERGVRSTIQIPTTGLFYAEAVIGTSQSGSTDIAFGVVSSTVNLAANPYNVSNAWIIYGSSSTYITRNGSSTLAGAGSALVSGDVVQIAIDLANNKGWVGKNNTWFNSSTGTDGNPSTGTNPTFTFSSPPSLFPYAHGYSSTIDANFGQRPFAYTPPTGYVSLNTYNLPTSTIVKGGSVMNAVTWSGATAGTNLNVTGFGFKPDLLWGKNRSGTYDHFLQDSVRGITNGLSSNSTAAESTTSGSPTSFLSDGFNISSTAGWSSLGNTNVTWAWQAGQGTTSSNTSGSITSTVSVNASAGFSIATYTGTGANATFGHGLGVAPAMVIVKSRSSGSWNWGIWHQSLTGSTPLMRFTTAALTNSFNVFRPASNTSSVFAIGDEVTSNENGGTYVAYCWSQIAGYSAFGSLTGNGSSDGPFVYTGFRPKFILFKNASAIASWWIFDTVRNTYNVADLGLRPNTSDAESTFSTFDIVSNGFKVRTSDSGLNGSGNTVIYAAFAENPFKNALAR